MHFCVIINPAAGSAEQAAAVRLAWAGRKDGVIHETGAAGDARTFAATAAAEGCELIIAAGGDGTINEVVNGLEGAFDRVRLGIIPLGTGNDLARTLAIPFDPQEALQTLSSGQERRIDLIKVKSQDQEAYCVNIAAGGFSGQVDEALTDDLKASWGPLAYLRGAAGILPDLTGYETTITYEDEASEHIETLNVIIANGRTAAAGLQVAPRANPEDGLLDIVVVRYGTLLDLAGVAAQLLAGDYLGNQFVMHRRAQSVRISSHPGMWFNIDGELHSKQPISFTIQPRLLRVIVGPEYVPEPVV